MWRGYWGRRVKPLKRLGIDGFAECQQFFLHRFAFFFTDIEFDADTLGELAFHLGWDFAETVHVKLDVSTVAELFVNDQPGAAGRNIGDIDLLFVALVILECRLKITGHDDAIIAADVVDWVIFILVRHHLGP